MADIDISIIKLFNDECKLRQLFFDSAHPIGDIYVQYPQQKTPTELYNQNGVTSSWSEVDYSGAFFRANGGNAAAFINKTDNYFIQENRYGSLKRTRAV